MEEGKGEKGEGPEGALKLAMAPGVTNPRAATGDHCRESLISTDCLEMLELVASLDYSASTFLDSVNRGGLSKPTEYTFTLTVNCWRVFEEILLTAELKSMLLDATSQKSLFCKVMDRATD